MLEEINFNQQYLKIDQIGRHHKEESKKKLAEYHKVKVVGPDGTIYNSVEEAAKQVGIHRGTLFRYLRENPEKGWKRLEQ